MAFDSILLAFMGYVLCFCACFYIIYLKKTHVRLPNSRYRFKCLQKGSIIHRVHKYPDGTYQSGFLTRAERIIMDDIQSFLDKHQVKNVYIFPQVVFSAFCQRESLSKKRDKAAFYAVSDLRPDFILWNRKLNKIAMVIEVQGNRDYSENDTTKKTAIEKLGLKYVKTAIPNPEKWSGPLIKSDIAGNNIKSIHDCIMENA